MKTDIERLRDALADRNLLMVARRTGLSYRTVWALAKNRTAQHQRATILALLAYVGLQPTDITKGG